MCQVTDDPVQTPQTRFFQPQTDQHTSADWVEAISSNPHSISIVPVVQRAGQALHKSRHWQNTGLAVVVRLVHDTLESPPSSSPVLRYLSEKSSSLHPHRLALQRPRWTRIKESTLGFYQNPLNNPHANHTLLNKPIWSMRPIIELISQGKPLSFLEFRAARTISKSTMMTSLDPWIA